MPISLSVSAKKISLIILATTLISGCNGEPPQSTNEYATQGIRDGKFDATGSKVVISSINHGGSLWTTSDNQRLYNWNHQSGQFSDLILTALSANGQVAMTSDQKNMVAWNAANGKSLGFWTAPNTLHSLSINNNGSYAALGRRDNLASILDISSGQIVRSLPHQDTVRSANFVPNTNKILTGSEDLTANLWNWRTGEKIRSWEHKYPVDLVVSNNQGTVAFAASYLDEGYLYDLNSGETLATTGTPRNRISAARFSKNDSKLLLGLFDGHVQLHDAKTGEMIKRWKAYIRPKVYREASHITDLSFGNGNEILAMGSNGLINHFKP